MYTKHYTLGAHKYIVSQRHLVTHSFRQTDTHIECRQDLDSQTHLVTYSFSLFHHYMCIEHQVYTKHYTLGAHKYSQSASLSHIPDLTCTELDLPQKIQGASG